MTCLICAEHFSWSTFSGPAEPCDCGLEVTDLTTWTDAEIARARAEWQRTGEPLISIERGEA